MEKKYWKNKKDIYIRSENLEVYNRIKHKSKLINNLLSEMKKQRNNIGGIRLKV